MASPKKVLKSFTVFDYCVFTPPEVPVQKKVKLPVILTPLPTADEDRLSSKTSGEGAGSAKQDTKDQSDTNHDHSDHAHDIPKPRMTEHDRPTQGGTNSKAHQHKPSAHYEITSPGLRWAAHDLRTKLQTDTDNVIRRKKTNSSVSMTAKRRILMGTIVKDSQDLLSILQRLILV